MFDRPLQNVTLVCLTLKLNHLIFEIKLVTLLDFCTLYKLIFVFPVDLANLLRVFESNCSLFCRTYISRRLKHCLLHLELLIYVLSDFWFVKEAGSLAQMERNYRL